MSAANATSLTGGGSIVADIDALIALLNSEIEAIEKGDFQSVTDLLPAKSELLEKFEASQPEIETALREGSDPDLREKVQTLGDLAARDGELLEITRAAAAGIATEISRIRDRHSLKGLYGKRGQQVADPGVPSPHIDRSV